MNTNTKFLKKVRSFSVFKYVLYKMQLDYMTLLVQSLLHHIQKSHKNYFGWKGKSWRGEVKLMDDILYDCKAFLSYDHEGDERLLSVVYDHVRYVVSQYIRDREKLFLLKATDNLIEYDIVPEEKENDIYVPTLYDQKPVDTEEERIEDHLLTEKEEPRPHFPIHSRYKQPSKKFRELESIKLMKKALNYEFLKSRILQSTKGPLNMPGSSRANLLISKRSRSLHFVPVADFDDQIKKPMPAEKGSMDDLTSVFTKRRNKFSTEIPQFPPLKIEKMDESSIEYLEEQNRQEEQSPRQLLMQLKHYFNIQISQILPEEASTRKASTADKSSMGPNLNRDDFKQAFLKYLESKNLKSLEIGQITARAAKTQAKSKKTKVDSILMKGCINKLHTDDVESVDSQYFEDSLYLENRDIEPSGTTWDMHQLELEYQRLHAKFNMVRRRVKLLYKSVHSQISNIHIEITKRARKQKL